MRRPLALALALAAAGAAGAQPSARSGPPAACSASLTDTGFLSLDLPGPHATGAPLACGLGRRGPAEARLLTLSTRAGVALGVGPGGQVYSLRVPGIAADLIPIRRADAPFVDGVLQTVATNQAARRASPRGRAALIGRTDPGASWNYHQAGAYQRGALADRPPAYSRMVAERFDPAHGEFEALTLAVQAHPSDHPGDRFFAYLRLRGVAGDTIELTQGWINASRDAFGEPATLDYFNVPYLTLNHDALPSIAVEGTDVSAQRWPSPRGAALAQGRWIAATAADGTGLALVTGGTGRLRYGGREIAGVDDSGSPAEQAIFVVSNIVTGRTIAPGEALFATSYLVFGPRDRLASKAVALAGRPQVRQVALAPPAEVSGVVGLCGGQRLTPCATAPRLALAARLCTQCLPVFELMRGRERVYSTEPYLGALTGRYLSDPVYSVARIVGWLYPVGVPVPPGYRPVPLTHCGLIRFSPKDRGRFAYLVR